MGMTSYEWSTWCGLEQTALMREGYCPGEAHSLFRMACTLPISGRGND